MRGDVVLDGAMDFERMCPLYDGAFEIIGKR